CRRRSWGIWWRFCSSANEVALRPQDNDEGGAPGRCSQASRLNGTPEATRKHAADLPSHSRGAVADDSGRGGDDQTASGDDLAGAGRGALWTADGGGEGGGKRGG